MPPGPVREDRSSSRWLLSAPAAGCWGGSWSSTRKRSLLGAADGLETSGSAHQEGWGYAESQQLSCGAAGGRSGAQQVSPRGEGPAQALWLPAQVPAGIAAVERPAGWTEGSSAGSSGSLIPGKTGRLPAGRRASLGICHWSLSRGPLGPNHAGCLSQHPASCFLGEFPGVALPAMIHRGKEAAARCRPVL